MGRGRSGCSSENLHVQMRGGLNEQRLRELCMVGFKQSMAFEGHVERNAAEGTSGPREWGLDCQAKACGFCPGKRKEGLDDGSSREGEGN